MKITYGEGKTVYGPGVSINLTGEEIAIAIDAWLTARNVIVSGPRTITVNGKLIKNGHVYVDPSGFVITPKGKKKSGRGKKSTDIITKKKRMVFGVSDWSEELGKEFEIFEVRPGETDEEAIARAKKSYSHSLECVIREVE